MVVHASLYERLIRKKQKAGERTWPRADFDVLLFISLQLRYIYALSDSESCSTYPNSRGIHRFRLRGSPWPSIDP
jgi:hypothetical protein